MPAVSVFIINYNTCDLLERCLKSIYETKDDLAIEVYVGDNSSNDASAEMVRRSFPEVSLIRYVENLGYTRSVNSLLSLGKGEYYLLAHADVEILPNTLREFVEYFERQPQAGILGGNLYYPDGTPNPCEILLPGFRNDLLRLAMRVLKRLPVSRRLVEDLDRTEWSHDFTSMVGGVWNACMMIRREVFETVGYFDERFFVWYADWDLCVRAKEVGWSVYYLYPAMAIHHERQSFAQGDTVTEEVRYKVDGWYSAGRQIEDRYVFLRKHCGSACVHGVKVINVAESALRLWLVLGYFLLGRTIASETSFRLRACRETLRAIAKA